MTSTMVMKSIDLYMVFPGMKIMKNMTNKPMDSGPGVPFLVSRITGGFNMLLILVNDG